MKEIAENAAAAAAAHCALHLDCFKTFPHHDIPPGSHYTLCTVLYCTAHSATAASLQHTCPAAEVTEIVL